MRRSTSLWMLPVILLALVFGLTRSGLAQDAPIELAAIQNGALLLVTSAGTSQPIPAPPGHISSMAWSPDGETLALDVKGSLFITGPGTSAAIPLDAGELSSGFSVTYAPDGTILYGAHGKYVANLIGYIVELRQIAPEAGAQPATLGQFEYGLYCYGGIPGPAYGQWRNENGSCFSYRALQWTPFGIIHVDQGAFLFDPATGEDRLLGNFSGLVVSPDGMMAAGLRYTFEGGQDILSLVLIDLATGHVTDMPTIEQPDLIAWGADGSVYYSTRTPSRDITAGMSETDRALLTEVLGCPPVPLEGCVTGYTVSVQRLDLVTGTETTRFTGDAYAIGRLREAADGSLVFSLIPNNDAWAQAIISGQLDPTSESFWDASQAFVPVTVYRLASDETTPVPIGVNLNQFELRPVTNAG